MEGTPDPLRKIWIIGAGKFGQLAVDCITRHLPEVEIILVDKKGKPAVARGVTFVCEDGISWLVANMGREETVDMIIPSIPVHMVAEWLQRKSSEYIVSPVSLSESLVLKFPHPIRNGTSQVYVSHADFLCPDNCAEPESVCSYTGEERGENMFQLLENISDSAFIPLVIRSYQLFPGVGGIYPKDMWSLLDRVHNSPNRPFLMATACRCHGVVDGLRFAPKS